MRKITLSLIAMFNIAVLMSQTTLVPVSYNGYVNEGASTVTLGTYNNYDLQIKNQTGFSRNGFVEFPLTDINPNALSIHFNVYLGGALMSDFPTTADLDQTPALALGVNQINYSFDNSTTWSNKTTPTESNETAVAAITLSNALKDTWISIDVTSIVIAQKNAGQSFVRFRLFATGGNGQLLYFRKSPISGNTISSLGAYYPRLVQVVDSTTELSNINVHNSILYPSIALDKITVKGNNVEIYDMSGRKVLSETIQNNTVNISTLRRGMYIVKTEEGLGKFIKQ